MAGELVAIHRKPPMNMVILYIGGIESVDVSSSEEVLRKRMPMPTIDYGIEDPKSLSIKEGRLPPKKKRSEMGL
jgi:hypothetical protein